MMILPFNPAHPSISQGYRISHHPNSSNHKISHNFPFLPKCKTHIFTLNLDLCFLFIIFASGRFLSWSSYNMHPDPSEMALTAVLFLSMVESNNCFFSFR
eukprot:TRINITY_DN40875_c0_g1_i1.p1 TRINITY_DN40875_c0_g1~~TRINITY_DN40875_c0_g1_i1.p1  ORF type:complete len:100 (+),score=3.09 TRINITY_DN40875_c0_g1_i1:239-538(+)